MKIEITHYGHKASYEFENDDVSRDELLMKIEITHYGHKASYEFENDDVSRDELLYSIEQLIRLIGYDFKGTLEIVNEEE